MPPRCPGVDFTPSLPMVGSGLPTENPILQKKKKGMRVVARFDDMSLALTASPLRIEYPNPSGGDVRLHDLLAWMRGVYVQLWSIEAMEWYHPKGEVKIEGVFKNPGESEWRLSLGE